MARDKNERQSLRHRVAVPVLIRHDGSCVEGLSINISEGGIYLFAAAHLAVGTQIEIEFQLPNGKRDVRARATVRRRAVYLYGIEFLKDSATAREHSIAQTDSGLPSPQTF